jgi:hypothetical protein
MIHLVFLATFPIARVGRSIPASIPSACANDPIDVEEIDLCLISNADTQRAESQRTLAAKKILYVPLTTGTYFWPVHLQESMTDGSPLVRAFFQSEWCGLMEMPNFVK